MSNIAQTLEFFQAMMNKKNNNDNTCFMYNERNKNAKIIQPKFKHHLSCWRLQKPFKITARKTLWQVEFYHKGQFKNRQ